MRTLYEILEVSEKASDEVIEKAYKTLVRMYHPDLQKEPKKREEYSNKMKEINSAYDILSNKEKRAKYDNELEYERQKEQNNTQRNNQSVNQSQVHRANNYSNMGYQRSNTNNYNTEKPIENWRDLLKHLTNREKYKLKRKIEKDARKEYESMYADYFRSKGFRVRKKINLKKIVTVILTILVMIGIGLILWIIPSTRQYFIEMYNENMIFRTVVNIFLGVIKGIIQTFNGISKNGF